MNTLAVHILYFAAVRDLLGSAEEDLELPAEVADIAALTRYLEDTHPELRGRLQGVRFAVNESFVSAEHTLTSGDVIAVIPPVAGG